MRFICHYKHFWHEVTVETDRQMTVKAIVTGFFLFELILRITISFRDKSCTTNLKKGNWRGELFIKIKWNFLDDPFFLNITLFERPNVFTLSSIDYCTVSSSNLTLCTTWLCLYIVNGWSILFLKSRPSVRLSFNMQWSFCTNIDCLFFHC